MKTTTLIDCACGCGEKTPDRDSRGRPKRFIAGHSSRLQPSKKVAVECENCRKPFAKGQHWFGRVAHHYCSQKCAGEDASRRGIRRGENNGHFNSVTVPCSGCDAPVTKPHSLIFRRNNRVYCGACKLRKDPAGPVSWADYPPEFSRQLRATIRERDGHRCQWCGKGPGEIGTPDVHHIDYDKHNNHPLNLISLCESCHGRTNFGKLGWQIALGIAMEKRFG